MVIVSANKRKQLLVIIFAGRVEVEQVVEQRQDVAALVAELEAGFRVLADLSSLESMSLDCAPEIAKTMELCAEKGVKLIVRVIPDPAKDIGFTILSRFHYRKSKPRMVVCQTMSEAEHQLGFTADSGATGE
jgi:anti-anti-sigma regulatory factor